MKRQTLSNRLRTKHIFLALALILTTVFPVLAGNDTSTEQLTHARIFGEPLISVGGLPPGAAEAKELLEITSDGHKSLADTAGELQAFAKKYPKSSWTPSLEALLAKYYLQAGYFTLALQNWQAAWEATRESKDWRVHQMADDVLVHWLVLLSSLGRTDAMKQLFDETKDRQISPGFYGLYHRTQQAYGIMLKHPEISYRCGTFALAATAQALTGSNYVRQIWEKPSPPTGFSMLDLVKMADTNHLNMVAVDRGSGQDLIVPSVVHWKQNHYAAIVGKKGDLYEVIDPTFQMRKWLTADAINNECSGQFMIAANQMPANWKTLDAVEASQIYGKGFPNGWDPIPCCPDDTCVGLAPCPPGTTGSGGNNGSNGGGAGGGSGGGGAGGGSCGGICHPSQPMAGPTGMPDWTVTEPGCDVWLRDNPMDYKPSKGPEISFKLFYSQEPVNNQPLSPDDALEVLLAPFGDDGVIFTCGQNWYPSWYSAVVYDQTAGTEAQLLAPGGGIRVYTNFDGTVPEFTTKTRMTMSTNADGSIAGFTVSFPSGARDVYDENYPALGNTTYFLSEQDDPQGNATKYIYETGGMGGFYGAQQILLQYVIDGDGNTNTFTYTTNVIVSIDLGTGVTNYTYYSNYLSQISGPRGTIEFSYPGTIVTSNDSPVLETLTGITDVMGMSSSFDYDTNGILTQMNTPYGPTSFYHSSAATNSEMDVITDPNGGHQMFLYVGDPDAFSDETAYTNAIPAVYTNQDYVPTYRPNDGALGVSNTLDNPDWANANANDSMQLANSFYWGRLQFSHLSAGFLSTGPNYITTNLASTDFILPRLRHWNAVIPQNAQSICLSMERDPSPDAGGTIPGEMTWYDYPGKPDYFYRGTSFTPILIIKVLPDGSERYTINQLDQWNNITSAISTYSENGTISLRTNSYVFAANGQDLLKSVDAAGLATSYIYDGNHNVLSMTDPLNEITSYAYNGVGQLASITQPNGQLTTNFYGSDGYLAQQIVVGISTNSYTYTNGLVYRHTDARGLTVTNSWDALNRLTNVLYPDGTSISYTYNKLDLVKVTDRMGFSTSYTYNAIEQKVFEANALNHLTGFGYCECGALDSITDALNNVTYFIHDNQGKPTETLYPDGYTVTNSYNLLGQLVTKSDSSGLNFTNYYNNQGLLITSSNNVGQIRALAYDVDDRVTNSTDANGVSIGMTYDNLSRIQTRRYPDTGVEQWGYTTGISSPTSYTNQIGNVMLYAYDTLNRKTNEICVGVTTNNFLYNGAGDLLALNDGKNDATMWGYDQYGRVTNKVDAAGVTNFVYIYDSDNRLTNRWTPAKGNTAYRYDPVGNLTNVAYNMSPGISLSYDADNRLNAMIDGIGATAYSYDQVGQLLSEGGLWPSDTVSNIYQNRLRMELSLSHPGGSPWTEDYSYDSARRLDGVGSSAGVFRYAYDPVKLQRVDELELPISAYITNTYDSVARLLSTALINTGGTNLDSAFYAYNAAGQRTSETNVAGDYRNYTYDNKGELITAKGKEAGGAVRTNEQFGYAYDAADNLNFRTNNALIQAFNVNDLNELTTTTNSGTLTVAGTTTIPVNNVKVNGLPANHYADATFALGGFTVTNGINFYQAIGEDGSGNYSTNSVTVNLPATNNYTYDANGNLLSDGTRNFGYDDENELISVCVNNAWSNRFAYDGNMRRRIERDYTWNSGWEETNEIHFIYDGNVVVEERSANNNPLVSYTRGNDLSGSQQGAGGIGGMLARTTYGQEFPGAPTTAFYHADGNGNITALMYPSQQLAAKYLYDPYGNMLAMSGPLMNFNKYRFSSKEWNDNVGLYYYLYRFYDPNLQRWVNRDPVEDLGFVTIAHRITLNGGIGPNPYFFVANSPVDDIDAHGLDIWFCTVPTSGFPLYGLGRHGYLWDDRSGTPDDKRECGQESCSSSGQHSSGNGGPVGNNGAWRGGPGSCTRVDGTTGKEQQIMDDCNAHINNGLWIPVVDDCQTHARKCLKNNGLNPPPPYRF